MNNYNLKKWSRLSLLMALLPMVGFVSCGDDKSDEPTVKTQANVKFNLTRASDNSDHFADEVESVALYVFDEKDLFVKVFEDSGDRLEKDGYTLPIDGLDPGEYTLVAWCGLKDDDDNKADFTVTDMKTGVSTRQEMLCRMAVRNVDGVAHSSADLNDLFYGCAFGVKISDKEEAAAPVYTLHLIQDTKEVEVIVKDLADTQSLKKEDFTFTYEGNNAVLDYMNVPVADSKVVYSPYSIEEKQLPGENSKSIVAKFKVNRLMADADDMLEITCGNNGATILAHMPLVDYMLLKKPLYTNGLNMTNQEYLDWLDDFILTLHVDNNKIK